ncbi:MULTISPECIES: helix-turn-helix domain-containing protein [unclassified Streptomyces]|uniref:helix-turn-helix domain-containing protein n=1 Tax=unclassified Streptomyces TaxID=2593676 RepID=UPI000C276C0A|nr:helix-turn-helix transcriptional regulator [Streptomyces sp. CB02959]PJN42307.1 transcriptional regulator [Streptomyces sp. CB02959]
MSSSKASTMRQQRLGVELRRLRERAGLSSTEAAKRLGGTPAQISNIEAGRYAVSAERVRTLAANYSCADRAYIDALAGMTGARPRGWWEEYREILPADLIDVAELEHSATALRASVMIHMPGLLQTAEYVRATAREDVPRPPAHLVEHRVSFRIKRQAVLFGDRPTPFTAIVHEAALRMGFGGPETARAQLNYLVEMSEHDHVSVLVIPFGEASFPASGQPINYASGPAPQLDTVELDTEYGCDFMHAEAQLEKYRQVLDRLESRALKPGESRDLIRRIARDI